MQIHSGIKFVKGAQMQFYPGDSKEFKKNYRGPKYFAIFSEKKFMCLIFVVDWVAKIYYYWNFWKLRYSVQKFL